MEKTIVDGPRAPVVWVEIEDPEHLNYPVNIGTEDYDVLLSKDEARDLAETILAELGD